MSNKHYLGRGEVVGFGSDKFYIKEGLFAKRVAISKILQGRPILLTYSHKVLNLTHE